MTVCLLRQLLPFLPKVQHGKQNMFTLSLFLKTYPTPSSTWRKQAEALEGRLFQNSQCQKLWRCCWSPRRLHTWKDGSDRQMFIFKKNVRFPYFGKTVVTISISCGRVICPEHLVKIQIMFSKRKPMLQKNLLENQSWSCSTGSWCPGRWIDSSEEKYDYESSSSCFCHTNHQYFPGQWTSSSGEKVIWIRLS